MVNVVIYFIGKTLWIDMQTKTISTRILASEGFKCNSFLKNNVYFYV